MLQVCNDLSADVITTQCLRGYLFSSEATFYQYQLALY